MITEFLSESFHITLEAVDMLWDVVKEIVWVLPTEADEREAVETMFRLHGRERGLSKWFVSGLSPTSDMISSCPGIIPTKQDVQ